MIASGGTTKYSYDADDRLLTAGKTTFTYDANGNRLSQKFGTTTTTYSYDPLNRLVTVAGGAANTLYSYDGDGNRVTQQVGNGVYQYTNDIATSLSVVLNEQGPDGNIDYVYGLSMISATSLAFQQLYQYDGIGSVVGVTDATGAAQEKYSYNPWGKTTTATDPLGTKNKYKFTGQALDPAAGLYYLRARYYDPAIGRLLTKDPTAGTISIPLTQNRFVYALNQPVSFTDPSGRTSQDTSSGQPPPPIALQFSPLNNNANSTLPTATGAASHNPNVVVKAIAGACAVVGTIQFFIQTTSDFLANIGINYIASNGGSQPVSNVPCYSNLPGIGMYFTSVPTAQ